MDNDSALPISDILHRLAAKTGLDKKLQEISVLEYWRDVVGDKAARACSIQRVEHGVLIVHCSSPVWRTELQMRKADIIARLNELVGAEVVRDIVLK